MESAIHIIFLITLIDLGNKVPSSAAELRHRSPTSGQNVKLGSPFLARMEASGPMSDSREAIIPIGISKHGLRARVVLKNEDQA